MKLKNCASLGGWRRHKVSTHKLLYSWSTWFEKNKSNFASVGGDEKFPHKSKNLYLTEVAPAHKLFYYFFSFYFNLSVNEYCLPI
jgi:hypothetical protein